MNPGEFITLLVAVVGTTLALKLPRRYAIVPLAVSMCAYPSTLLLPPEGLALTAQRVIAMCLLGRCIASRDIRSTFKWGPADWAGAIYFGLMLVSQLLSQGPEKALVNRGGFFLSAMAPFWCVRFLITDRAAFYALLKGFLWTSVPLAVLGWVFMTQGYSPYYAILIYQTNPPFIPANTFSQMRLWLGQMFYRAHAPFLQCIMFGWFFAIQTVPATNLFFQARRLFPWIIAWLFLPLGIISAVAGGPMMFTFVSFLLLSLFPLRQHGWKFVGIAALMFVALNFLARRSPMEILVNQGMASDSSWYRIKLMNALMAPGVMSGHWLQGFGEVPLHLIYMGVHDLCIQWVYLLVYNGLMGMVGFHALVAVGLYRLWQARLRARSLEDQWLLWSLMATTVGSLFAMLVVALFSEMMYIYHLFLALLMNAPLVVGGGVRQVGILAQRDGQTVLLRYTLTEGQRLAVVQPGATPAKPAHPPGA